MALRSTRHRNRPIAALARDAGTTIGPPCATIYLAMNKADDERSRRLAEALRMNLRRRKAQARGQAPEPEKKPEDDGQPD